MLDLDTEIIIWLSTNLGINTPIVKSSELNVDGKREEKIINICKKLSARELYDSKTASNFLNLKEFQKQDIKLEFQNYLHPTYKQLYEPFIPYMSTLDLIFRSWSKKYRYFT